jgi:hypothetical protein
MPAKNIQLVPPSLRVIASLMTNRIELPIAVVRLRDSVYMGTSFGELGRAGYPLIKVAATSLGFGLTIAYTEHLGGCGDPSCVDPTGLVWIHEIACHPGCAIFGRKCQANLSGYEWLKMLEHIHLEWLDRIPQSA